MKYRSLRKQLLVIALLSTLLALLISFGAIITYDLRSYHATMVSDMTTQADLLGHMTAPALSFDDKRLAQENLDLLRIRSRVRSAAIYNAQGGLFASYVAPGEKVVLPRLPEVDTVRVEGDRALIFKRIVDNNSILGTVYLNVDYDLRDRLLSYIGIATVFALLALLAALILMSRLVKVATQPISSIADIAREVVERRDYSRRAPKTTVDEVGVLADSFNDMLAEIENRTRDLEASNREIAREAQERSRAQQEVMRLNEDLERRVHERTQQLETTNGELALAKEAAEKANQAKSTFLSGMSHELRTPLNAVLGFAQLMADDSGSPLPAATIAEYSGHILKAGEHLLTLINEILNLARIESGTVALSLETVELAGVLAECRLMLEPMAVPHGIRLLFPKDLQLHVKADRTRLKQILLNLISNAIKYNREMGAVVIDCTQPDTGRVRISVQDTGAGLRPDQLQALFQPFNRLGQETGSQEGTGIGLVVTRRLVELMAGAIGVSSTVGIGSVFWVELPAAAALNIPGHVDTVPLRVIAGSSEASTQPTLLYVEDNPANVKLVEEIIRLRGDLSMLSAPDGHLGVEMARAHLPRIILMDISLPGMNGFAALQVLRANPKTARIPVIALTANAMPRDVERGLEAGFFRYLTKPINVAEFSEAIDAALDLPEGNGAKEGKEGKGG